MLHVSAVTVATAAADTDYEYATRKMHRHTPRHAHYQYQYESNVHNPDTGTSSAYIYIYMKKNCERMIRLLFSWEQLKKTKTTLIKKKKDTCHTGVRSWQYVNVYLQFIIRGVTGSYSFHFLGGGGKAPSQRVPSTRKAGGRLMGHDHCPGHTYTLARGNLSLKGLT